MRAKEVGQEDGPPALVAVIPRVVPGLGHELCSSPSSSSSSLREARGDEIRVPRFLTSFDFETDEAKNDLETYVDALRDKVDLEKERDALSTQLTVEEDWACQEGDAVEEDEAQEVIQRELHWLTVEDCLDTETNKEASCRRGGSGGGCLLPHLYAGLLHLNVGDDAISCTSNESHHSTTACWALSCSRAR